MILARHPKAARVARTLLALAAAATAAVALGGCTLLDLS